MRQAIEGTFHFHSTYSHDGKSTLPEIASTLKERGYSFCVMTEHFEDFDAAKFDRYCEEIRAVSQSSGFLLVPGIEVNVSGLDTLIFPVRDYDEVVRFADGNHSDPRMFKVLAHPTKYPYEKVIKHLEKYAVNGVELWNQQADGSRMPPTKFLTAFQTQADRNRRRYFFGCDLHKVTLTVANVISITTPEEPTVESVSEALINGDFVTRNLPTGIEYRNGAKKTEFDAWLRKLLGGSYLQAKVLKGVRGSMKTVWKKLPKNVQVSLNDVKNFVRNKV